VQEYPNLLLHKLERKIFDSSSRSLIELILNSVDAYRSIYGKPSIGKLGMGFYSIFEYLLGKSGNTITIDSYVDENDNWRIRLFFEDEIKYEFKPSSFRRIRGTKIEIDTIDGNLFPNVSFVSFIPDVTIRIIDKIQGNEEIVNENFLQDSIGEVEIIYDKDYNFFSIEDWATGISENVLYQSLLVPAVSTKKIQYTEIDPNFVGITGIYDLHNDNDNFFLLVGDVPNRSDLMNINLLIKIISKYR